MRHSTLLVKYASDQAVSDASLMSDFLRTNSPAAFQELMHRHGPLVWSVGRRMNLTVADAEDMFQATFLVLFEQAARWQQSGTLACWLYGIAWRIGTKLKRNTVREQQRQQRVALAEGYESRDDGWQLHLDAALAQLPAHYREPLVLCYLEGQTHAKAAQTLGWPIGTVAGRLARARELLRRRLIQQGIAPAVLTTALVEPLRASLPEGLQVQTWQCLQQRVPPALQSLIQGVFPIMNKSALVMASCLLLLAVAGLCWAAYPVPEPQRSTVQPIGKAEEASAEDYQRLQGTWLRSINHEITGWTVGGEGLVFRDKAYTVLYYPTETDGQVVRMADPKATKSRNFALSKVNGALRIELIDYGFDTQNSSGLRKIPNGHEIWWSATLVMSSLLEINSPLRLIRRLSMYEMPMGHLLQIVSIRNLYHLTKRDGCWCIIAARSLHLTH